MPKTTYDRNRPIGHIEAGESLSQEGSADGIVCFGNIKHMYGGIIVFFGQGPRTLKVATKAASDGRRYASVAAAPCTIFLLGSTFMMAIFHCYRTFPR